MGVLRRMKNLWRRSQVSSEIEAELKSHLEMAAEDAVLAGMSAADAQRAARLRFGNPVALRERTLGADAILALESIGRDAKFALRQLKKSPAFAATAILTLALGIGATTAIFTLIQQVMLRTLPVARAGQLWRIGDSADCCYSDGYTQRSYTAQNDWSLFSWEAYRFLRDNTPAFEDLAAFELGEGNAELAVRRAGSPAPAQSRNGEYVSGNFFRTFGISAWRGHLFTNAEDREGGPPVAVLSFHTWQEKYGSDPSVVGATYEINGHAVTVIGIAPPGFFGAKVDVGTMPDFWLPLTTEPILAGPTSRLKNPRLAWLALIGRTRSGTNSKSLEAQLQGELHQWLASHVADMSPQERSAWEKQTLHLTSGGAGVSLMRKDYAGALRLLLAAALCVLLLACANIANLLLARGLKDRSQAALRAVLGASRARLLRKALTESLILSVFGAAAGIGVAYAGAQLILNLARGANTWLPIDATPSIPVLLFALSISVITGVVFGLASAWMTCYARPIEALHGANRTVGVRRGIFGAAGTQNLLVILQTALSVVLLAVAAMLSQSLRNLEHQDFGFKPSGRYLISIDPKISNYRPEQLVPLFGEIEERLRAIPGVRGVGSVLEAPPGGWITHTIRIEGRPGSELNADSLSGWTRVTPGFFATLGNRIVTGRSFTDGDDASTRPVAVVNQAFAKKFFGTDNPIGQHFGLASEEKAGTFEIVGVAANLEFENDMERPMYFVPEAQSMRFADAEKESREIWSHYLYGIVVWTPGDPPGVEEQIRTALGEIAPNLVLNNIQPYSEVLRDYPQQNMISTLSSLFAVIGLLLAALGLYGVMAYRAQERTSEIGVRMAVGANRSSIVAMMLRTAFGQVGIGLALGIPAAIAAGRAIASRLVGIEPWSPTLLAFATMVLMFAALAAAAIPARRAAAVDPMRALRME